MFISATGNKHKIQRWRDVSPFPDVSVFSDFKVCSHYLHVLTGKNLIQKSLVTIFCFFSNWRFDRKLFFIPTIFIDTFNVLPRVLVARAVHYSKLVSLRNRTEEENGKTPVCKIPDRAITCEFCRDLHLPLIFSGLLQKDLSTERWSLAESYSKQNYCHACHTRFAVFFPLPSCCVNSLLFNPTVVQRLYIYNIFSPSSIKMF